MNKIVVEKLMKNSISITQSKLSLQRSQAITREIAEIREKSITVN